jgi:hypothetical protein
MAREAVDHIGGYGCAVPCSMDPIQANKMEGTAEGMSLTPSTPSFPALTAKCLLRHLRKSDLLTFGISVIRD